ncbi:MAG: glycosyltransferase family 4 protein [Infirmifilum sp.]
MKPKLLVFSELFWPEGSGAELATYLIVKDILSKYFDVIVVSGTGRPDPGVLGNCRYIYWGLLRGGYKPLEWAEILANVGHVRRLIEGVDVVYIPSHTLLPLAVIAKRLKPDMRVAIHLHDYQPLTYTSVVLSDREPDLATDIIVERWEHESIARAMATGLLGFLNKVNMLALRVADMVICVSRRQCELILERMPWLKPKTYVVHNPPPPIQVIEKRPNKTPTFLYGGGFSVIKGVYVIAKALKYLERRRETWRARLLITFGRVGKRRRLIEALRRLNTTKVEILGRIPYQEVLKLHREVWTLLFPSIYEEPLPYAVLESALLGTIPIASRTGGIPEILEGTPVEKYMFTPGDAGELAGKIEDISSLSPEELLDVGSRLRELTIKKFNVGKVEARLLKVFELS